MVSFTIAGILISFQRYGFLKQGTEISQRKLIDLDGVNEIIVDAGDAKVKINKVESQDMGMVYNGNIITNSKEDIPELINMAEDGTLIIRIKEKSHKKIFNYSFFLKNELIVSIPENYTKRVSILEKSN